MICTGVLDGKQDTSSSICIKLQEREREEKLLCMCRGEMS